MKKLFLFLFLIFACNAMASEREKLYMLMYTPSDVELPKDHRQRFKEIADFSEDFFAKWMKHWGYDCPTPLNIARDKDGFPEILYWKGDRPSTDGHYSVKYAFKTVIPAIKRKYKLSNPRQVFWMLSYPGAPRSFRGGGKPLKGGICVGNYEDAQGSIKPGGFLTKGFAGEIKLKAFVHELGHALGLPHIGPIAGDQLGNSLMGPVTNYYRKKIDANEDRVYLTKACAAMLWRHPLFKSPQAEVPQKPVIETSDVKAIYNAEKKELTVRGKLTSNMKAHSIVISNYSDKIRNEYLTKTFTAKVDKDGNFVCVLQEFEKNSGTLALVYAFENGHVMGHVQRGKVHKELTSSCCEGDSFVWHAAEGEMIPKKRRQARGKKGFGKAKPRGVEKLKHWLQLKYSFDKDQVILKFK